MTTAEAAGIEAVTLSQQIGTVKVRCVELACNALLDAIREYSNAARD
jgi:hypothetical protein